MGLQGFQCHDFRVSLSLSTKSLYVYTSIHIIHIRIYTMKLPGAFAIPVPTQTSNMEYTSLQSPLFSSCRTKTSSFMPDSGDFIPHLGKFAPDSGFNCPCSQHRRSRRPILNEDKNCHQSCYTPRAGSLLRPMKD